MGLQGDKTYKQIAADNIWTLDTVKKDIEGLYKLLGVKTRNAAVKKAEELQIIPPLPTYFPPPDCPFEDCPKRKG